jgi:phage FluMu protein Com
MRFQTIIKNGKAKFMPEGLRCTSSKEKDPSRNCNKLIAKKTGSGQLAGDFKCPRCGQSIVVELQILNKATDTLGG